MLFRAFYALPDSIKGTDGKPVNALLGAANLILREVEHHGRAPSSSASARTPPPTASSSSPATTPSAREVPEELLPQCADAARSSRRSAGPSPSHDSLEADDLLGTYARLEAEAGGRALLLTGDRDMFQCANERTQVLYVRTGGKQGAEEVGPGRGRASATGSRRSSCPTSSPCAATPPTGSRARRASARRPRPSCCASTARSRACSTRRSASARPKLRTTLIDSREDLLAFKDIATLRDAGVERPPDRPTDWEGAAAAARERGMNRLAERLAQAD